MLFSGCHRDTEHSWSSHLTKIIEKLELEGIDQHVQHLVLKPEISAWTQMRKQLFGFLPISQLGLEQNERERLLPETVSHPQDGQDLYKSNHQMFFAEMRLIPDHLDAAYIMLRTQYNLNYWKQNSVTYDPSTDHSRTAASVYLSKRHHHKHDGKRRLRRDVIRPSYQII